MVRLFIFVFLLVNQVAALEKKTSKPRSFAKLLMLIETADESLHIEGCREGSSNDCLVVALKYELSSRDELAFDYFSIACNDYNDGSGCAHLGIHFQSKNDIDQALYYFKKACDLNDGLACFELVFAKAITICGDLVTCTYYDFSEDPKHREELRRLIRKACHLGYERACRLLR
jgi:TPR repeat protein